MWDDAVRTFLLQSVLVGKAQEAYIALSKSLLNVYHVVKEGVLKANELVPEAYRQCFRGWRKGEKHPLEVARELTGQSLMCFCRSRHF